LKDSIVITQGICKLCPRKHAWTYSDNESFVWPRESILISRGGMGLAELLCDQAGEHGPQQLPNDWVRTPILVSSFPASVSV
jgi:hypothetical protein